MDLMEADFCFLSLQHLEARGIFEKSYARLDNVPPQTWRSASNLWIREPPLWSKLEHCLSMDSCSVKALRIGFPGHTQSVDWDGLWKILADPVCSLTCLCLETHNLTTEDVGKLFAQLQLTSRLQHLRLESCTMSEVDCEVIAEALSNPACPLLGLSLRVYGIHDTRPLGLFQHRERKLVCLGLWCLSQSFEVEVWLCDLLGCLIDLRLEASDGSLLSGKMPEHLRLYGPLDVARKIASKVGNVGLDRLSLLYRPPDEFGEDRRVRAIKDDVQWLPGFCLKLKELVLEGAFLFGELARALVDPDCILEALSVSPEYTLRDREGEDALHSFSQALLHPHCRLKCFEFVGGFGEDDRVLTHIARALSSEDFKLESLFLFTSISSELGKRLVDALEHNWTLCELKAKLPCDVQPRASNLLWRNLRLRTLQGNVPSHDQLGARNLLTKNQSLTEGRSHHVQSGTSDFLSSNQSFTGGMLPHQCQMQPRSARLFLCGHERVGKTTIRRQIFYLAHKRVINPLHKVRKEVPTRGMELQALTFGKKEKKQLVICDLAGHKEYHAFHHFFVTGSDRDLFLVVCKITDRPLEQDFAFKLRYWLRFIASHRSPGKPCPKVMVVLNFFSSPLSKDVMTSIAKSNTEKLLEEYADVLDLGKHGALNVFGIDALKLHNFPPIIQRLEDLLTELLDSRSSIPRICDEISSIIMPSRMTLLIFGRPRDLCLPLSLIVRKYEKKFGNDSTQTNSGDRFLAALVELHNAGQVVFFPAHDEQKSMEQIVIIDCEWFCSNLIGILMQPEKLMGYERRNVPEQPGVWLREEVTQILLQQNCKPEYVHHVLEYLQRLGLSYPVQDDEMNGTLPTSKLIFPSLLLETQPVQWLECDDKAAVFGRRLECQDKVKTLLPTGAFARLQVNLHSKFGNSWRVGCGWISFMENGVATIVRFGGETSRWEDRQWIDIMVRYPEPLDEHENAVEEVVQFVKKQIFAICQGMDRGVPAVALLESVMSEGVVKALNSVSVDVVPLSTIKEELRKNGIGYQMTWSDYTGTPILDLFLSGELRELLALDFNALSKVAHEFDAADSDGTDSPPLWFGEQEDCGVVSDASLSEDNRLLFHLIKREHRVLHDRLNKQGEILQDISEGVAQIRKNMGLLLKKLERKEGNILSSCSYQLVKDLITGPLPAFPFLTDEAGVWQQLKNLVGKEVKLHFMCEWYAGAHVIEGQKGLLVKISKPEWLVRAGPVLVPALKVMSCVAALAATVYLHGSRVFVPSFEWLDALGLNGGPGQRAFPAILKSFVDEVPELEELPSCQLPVDRSRLSDFLFELTKGKTVVMETDFQLYRVEVPQKNRISWVCQDHSKGLKRLQNQSPFERTNTGFG